MSKTSNRQIRKFNPGTFQSDEELIQQFVVRKHELGIVLETLRGNMDSQSCQHVLVVAPRGRGKTMLLARAAAEIHTNKELSGRLLPVRFTEESQEIFNMADFWLEALFHLARESAPHDSDLAQELRTTHADLSAHWGDRSLEDRARAAVLGAADRLDRKLVLMVENLQSICDSVDADFGWKLRGALQSEPKMMLLASATSRFEGLDEADQPFFELFRIIGLEPLNTEECRLLWQAVSGDAVSGREVRPLQILTGGSPRLLVIVAGFAQHHSLRQLMEELVTLIDEHTEYFRSHLEVLAKTERRVYLAVIDLWRPSSTAEIAARARMDVRTVSTMLGRLVERGAIITEGSGRKRLYAAAERLYSIYYKLRRERDEAAIVENLIRFMVVFYNDAERAEMFPRLIREAMESPAIREGLERTFQHFMIERQTPKAFHTAVEKIDKAVEEISKFPEKIHAAFQEKAFQRVIEIAGQALASLTASSPELSNMRLPELLESYVAWLWLVKVQAYLGLEDFKAAIAACDGITERFGNSFEPGTQDMVAAASLYKGDALGQLGDFEAAIPAYEEGIKLFGDINRPEIQRFVVIALINKSLTQIQGGRADEALQTCEALERRLGTFFTGEEETEFRWRMIYMRSIALLLKGKHRSAMDAFRSAYALFTPDNEMMLDEILQVAQTLLSAGASADELVKILASDEVKFGALAPLTVALRQYAGEGVRVPAEVLEVAADILKNIEEKLAKGVP